MRQNVVTAWNNIIAAREAIRAAKQQVSANALAFSGVKQEALVGSRTTLDVLDAEQALLDAESLRVSARATLYVAAYAVLSSTGRLTARDLNLPVQLYDPAAYYNLVKDSPTNRSKQAQQLDRVLRALQKD